MPQPFTLRKNQKLERKPRVALAARPECATAIAIIASEWAGVERAMVTVFSLVTGKVRETGLNVVTFDHHAPSRAAMNAIQNLRLRIEVFEAATEAVLGVDKKAEFAALKVELRRCAGERNAIVHGIWCSVDAYPSDVILDTSLTKLELTRYTKEDLCNTIDRLSKLQERLLKFGQDFAYDGMIAHIEAQPLRAKPTAPPRAD